MEWSQGRHLSNSVELEAKEKSPGIELTEVGSNIMAQFINNWIGLRTSVNLNGLSSLMCLKKWRLNSKLIFLQAGPIWVGTLVYKGLIQSGWSDEVGAQSTTAERDLRKRLEKLWEGESLSRVDEWGQ